MVKRSFQIDHIFLDRQVQKSALAQRVLRTLKETAVTIIDDKNAFLAKNAKTPLAQGKKNLWITSSKGSFLKPCPATGSDYLCCQYWTINAQTHCPLDCTYCILQHYLNVPFLTLNVNTQGIFKEIDSLLRAHPGRLFRMGTGELTDSLALDPITRFNESLIRHVQDKKMILEIKTKTDFIDHLPKISRGNVLISWSLNPDAFIQSEEFKSASLDQRLDAALRAVQKGYRLGFHFDPLLMLPGWADHYTKLLHKLTARIPEKEVVWISLGSLRFPPALKRTIENRFPKTKITTAEWVRGLDGKARYFREHREKIYRSIHEEIRKKWKKVFIYFCMENQTVWKNVMGFAPKTNGELDFLFHQSIAERFPGLELKPPCRKIYRKVIKLRS